MLVVVAVVDSFIREQFTACMISYHFVIYETKM
jgi:hypothetical protein